MLKHGNSIYFTCDILVCLQNPVTNRLVLEKQELILVKKSMYIIIMYK